MDQAALILAIKNFLEDDSTDLSASIPQIIKQAEEIIFQRIPNLPCYRQRLDGVTVSGTESYIIPNARMIRQVSIIASESKFTYLNHRIDSYLRDYWPNPALTGVPVMYNTNNAGIAGTIITLAPTPDSGYTFYIDYIAPEKGLSGEVIETWVSKNAENVLLSACLYEASAFLQSAETLALYKTQFDEAIQLFGQEMQRNYAAEFTGGL